MNKVPLTKRGAEKLQTVLWEKNYGEVKVSPAETQIGMYIFQQNVTGFERLVFTDIYVEIIRNIKTWSRTRQELGKDFDPRYIGNV